VGCGGSVASSVPIYLSIYEIYIAPLQGNYSEALPAQARAKIKVLRCPSFKRIKVLRCPKRTGA